MNNSILWRVSTRQHNWRNGRFLEVFLQQAIALQLIGPATWQKIGIHGKEKAVALANPLTILENLPMPKKDEPPNSYIEIGGVEPVPWTLKLSVSLVDEASQELKNLNMLWLFFDRQWLTRPKASQTLIDAFLRIQGPGNSEYAFIHPYDHWLDWGDRAYKRAVTTGSFFKGVFWANFLGPGHLEQFEPSQLQKLPALHAQWDDGFTAFAWWVVDDVLQAETTAVEPLLAQLTEYCRQSLRPDSQWR